MYTGHHRTNVIKNGVLSFIIYINGTNLNAGASRKIYRRLSRQYGMMDRVYRGCSRYAVFCESFAGCFGTQTVNNDFKLSNCVSRVRINGLCNVNCNHNPKHIYTPA